MSTLSYIPSDVHTADSSRTVKRSVGVCLVAALAGLSVAWPLLYAALFHGSRMLIRSLTGDSYHYLAIARKAQTAHIYTYDGVHVTNGFHPLWQYFIRVMFALLHLQTHEAQAIAVIFAALAATTVGITLASAAVIRMTNHYFLGMLMVPGLYYLVIGVHVRNLSIWSTLNGMESAFSILFGGLFFFVLSMQLAQKDNTAFDLVGTYRALGMVLPFIILSRLDDVFLLPAFLLALVLFETGRKRIVAGAWIATPSAVAILCYLIYNKVTVGVIMPLSGGTKAGFVGALSAYLTAAVHLPMIMDLKSHLTRTPANGAALFSNSFRFVEVIYPLVAAAFGIWAIWKYQKRRREASILFALCLYIVFKMSYNFLNVHPWNQADWYYALITLTLSVLGALALRQPWDLLGTVPIAKYGIATVYVMMLLLSASQYYAAIVLQEPTDATIQFWQRRQMIHDQLLAHGVTGLINEDDGISAFLLDLPNLHGFAFATDVEGQRSFKQGRMLTLAYKRGINGIVGFGYMNADTPPQTDSEIRSYLRASLAAGIMQADMEQFDFALAYYDPVLKMPFISFRPKLR